MGWGMTEKNVSSSTLLEAYLPYIDSQTCRNMHGSSFRPYLGKDKFCAGHQTGNSLIKFWLLEPESSE